MQRHVDDGGTHFVMEVTSEGIDQGRVADVRFNIKLLTNITRDHLDYHKTFDAYQHVKFDFMRTGNPYTIYPENFSKITTPIPTLLHGEFNQLNVQTAAMALRHIGLADLVIVTEDNPRFEDSLSIINDITQGFPAEFKNYHVIQNRRTAIAYFINNAKSQDVVILAGKGHETYQIHGSDTLHLDDREEALKAISQRAQFTTNVDEKVDESIV
jgi:UDP-N-acetylmuramyl tripeptide synthase